MVDSMKLAFIGGGNMAASLIGGLVADGYDPGSILVADIDTSRLEVLAQRFSVRTFSDATEAVSEADTVVFSVKPQILKSVVQNLAATINVKQPLLLSIAAGIRTADIEKWSSTGSSVVRAMPNTPALVQCGASALYANQCVSEQQKEIAESILRATGLAVWVETEEHMDIVTALSGSGPAYFFRIMEAMQKAAVELGLPEKTAQLLTLQTALGSAKLAMESQGDVATLRQSVTSPGGTTEKGLQVLNDNNVDDLVRQVIGAAYQRSIELADKLGE